MAVLEKDRKKSSVEFIHKARQIVEIINDRMTKYLDKLTKKYNRYKYVVSRVYSYNYEAPIRFASEAYLYVTCGNRVYLKDIESLNERIRLFKLAIESYNKLDTVMSVLFKIFKSCFTASSVKNIVNLIDVEVNEIKLIIQSNEEKIKQLGLNETL